MPSEKGLYGVLCALFFGIATAAAEQPPAGADAQLLKSAGIATDTPSLLQYFRQRSIKNADRAATETLAPDRAVAAARLLAERGEAQAIAALLDFIPNVDDDWALDEIFASLATLTIRHDKLDPRLAAALHDGGAERRAAAVYILGRFGDLDQRATVRSYLADRDATVRRRAAQSLVGKQAAVTYRDLAAGDEALLKKHGLETKETALLAFLRRRTLQDEDQQRLKGFIVDLGAPSFKVRDAASKALVKQGIPALAFLMPALNAPDAEVARRAGLCVDEIRRGPGPALPAAAIRLLAKPQAEKGNSPAAAIRVLLAYVPFADDETVEDEVAVALALLSTREVRIDPLVPEALRDALPARRAMAARVLSKVGTAEHRAGLRKLLDDPVFSVRLRAAEGLVHARDKTAVPKLIALLNEAPPAWLWQMEDTLQRLAGVGAPVESVGDGSVDKRQMATRAWSKWWAANASTIDWARHAEGAPYQGLLTVCEYDSAIRQPGGQVWEIGRDGKERWKISGVMGAMDAQVLPNGRVLVAENAAGRVTERDLNGAVKWEYRTPGNNPIACQRLPNGNTFIATYNQVMEITPDQRQVYLANQDNRTHIFSARKMRDGQVVVMTAQGTVRRFDPITQKEYVTVNLGPNGGWCSAEALPNGRYLVATMNDGQVREVDATGATHWSVAMQGAFRATRLPNGNTLVASMTTRQIAEFDRNGNKRWEKTCDGRPWSVRYR